MSGWKLSMAYVACDFFEFDRPEMCQGGALEGRIEQNGLKMLETNVPEGL